MYCQANTMQYDDDGERLRRISCADRDAFEQLYLDYHKRLVKFLSRVIRRYEDLEEVINDAFLIVWQRAGDFRGASRVSTWIFGIAYRCDDHFRGCRAAGHRPGRRCRRCAGRMPRASVARYSDSCRARAAMTRAIGKAAVAAGDGALSTCTTRGVSANRKSCTRVPSPSTACARIPAG